MRACFYQVDRRFVAVFGLTADIAHGLVQQNGDLFVLLSSRQRIDIDAVQGADRLAQHSGFAIHPHPALGDPVVGFTARAHAEFGHAFIQSDGVVIHVWLSVWLRSAGKFNTRMPP